MARTVHNFKNTKAILAGMIVTGFADGDAIQSERNEDKRTHVVGAGGDVTINESNNDTGTVTLTLKPSSPALPLVRSLYNSGEQFNVMLIDTALGVTITGEDCVIPNLPPFSRAEEVSGVEVTILAAKYSEN